MVDGKPPVFEVVDKLTVRYSWDAPNPDFLPSLAAAQPLVFLLPAHYMKQFHEKYQDEAKLAELVKANKVKNWVGLHQRMARQYRPENPDLPTLDPWRNTTKPPAEQFVFDRNPFFHRVDENGLQLPYIDQFVLNVSSSSIIPAKTGAGESDLQFTGIDFADYTFLKDAEKRYPVKVNLWKRTQGSRVALLPNLNAADPVWRAAAAGCARPPRPVAGASTGARSTWRCSTAWARKAPTRCFRKARSTSQNTRTPGSLMIRTRPTRCSTKSASQNATTMASAFCPTDGAPRSSSNRPAKARSRPTCLNLSRITGARSASRCSSGRRNATSSAAAPWAARS